MFKKAIEAILEIFFPLNETERILKTINSGELFEKIPKNWRENDYEIYSIFDYKDLFIKNSIYELKNNKNKYAIKIFSEILLEDILNYLEENLINVDQKILVTWVPQHKSTYLDKGYNQGEELAAELCSAAPNNFKKNALLKKIKKTKPQHETKNRKERLRNLKNSFKISVPSSLIADRLVIIIDDVYTTGATLKESRRVLLKAGASKVICFTIAH